VAACLNNLAVLLKAMGRHAEAQAMYERCIAIKEQAMGPTHPQVSILLPLRKACSNAAISHSFVS
jgi:hypothetical protein